MLDELVLNSYVGCVELRDVWCWIVRCLMVLSWIVLDDVAFDLVMFDGVSCDV